MNALIITLQDCPRHDIGDTQLDLQLFRVFWCTQDGDFSTGCKPAVHAVGVQHVFLPPHTGHRIVVHLFSDVPKKFVRIS